MAAGKSARTVNNYARSILRIWEATKEAARSARYAGQGLRSCSSAKRLGAGSLASLDPDGL